MSPAGRNRAGMKNSRASPIRASAIRKRRHDMPSPACTTIGAPSTAWAPGAPTGTADRAGAWYAVGVAPAAYSPVAAGAAEDAARAAAGRDELVTAVVFAGVAPPAPAALAS